MLSRRQLIAGASTFPLAALAPQVVAQPATPVATQVVSAAPTTEEILAVWLDAQDALRQLGERAVEAFWNNDLESLSQLGTPEVVVAFQGELTPGILLESLTTNQIHFEFAEAAAWFFGQYTPDKISGAFSQGGIINWEAIPNEPQTGDVPTGRWIGNIGPGVLDLGIILDFAGEGDTLEVNLSIPSQFLVEHPMQNVVFAAEVPIDELIDERILPAGGEVVPTNIYAVQYQWGANTLSLNTVWTGDGQLAGLQLVPQGTLPEVQPKEPIRARLPFDGAWMVFWGGDTEFQNYHALVPAQRYALDLAIWRDGATATAPGTSNEDYHAFGQPYLTPVSGEIVEVVDGMDDIPPQQPGSNPSDHPAGNHIVIETEGGFVFLAHCQNGSIRVQKGDTVSAGEVVAAVGNSGNTSEPHVHIHAQTSPDMFDPEVQGIPLIFENALENGELAEELSVLHGTIVEQRS